MKYKTLCVAALAVFFSACNNENNKAEDRIANEQPAGEQKYSDTASSFVRVFADNGKVCIQKSNTYYELVDAYEGNSKIPLMLKIKKTELCYMDSVNRDKVYEVEAKSILDSKELAWQSKFVATDVSFRDNTIYTIHEGNDAQEDLITFFSLLNGKEVFSCSYGELKVGIPNVKAKRFIGFTSRNAATDPIRALNEENLIGTIQYSDGSKLIDVLKLKLKRSVVAGKIPSYTPEMILVAVNDNTKAIEDGKSLILMKADENYQAKDVSDFSAQFTFYYGDDNEATKITIPVVNDRLDIARAAFDKDIFEIVAQ